VIFSSNFELPTSNDDYHIFETTHHQAFDKSQAEMAKLVSGADGVADPAADAAADALGALSTKDDAK
jgi:hypothetical protein